MNRSVARNEAQPLKRTKGERSKKKSRSGRAVRSKQGLGFVFGASAIAEQFKYSKMITKNVKSKVETFPINFYRTTVLKNCIDYLRKEERDGDISYLFTSALYFLFNIWKYYSEHYDEAEAELYMLEVPLYDARGTLLDNSYADLRKLNKDELVEPRRKEKENRTSLLLTENQFEKFQQLKDIYDIKNNHENVEHILLCFASIKKLKNEDNIYTVGDLNYKVID